MHPKGYVKSEHQDAGFRKDTYTAESGAALVGKVMHKAETVHATAGGQQNWRLGTNQAKHVSGSDDKGGFRELGPQKP
jgi:hypothetical protein